MLGEPVDDELLSKNPAHSLKPFPEDDSMQRKPFHGDEVKLLIIKAADPNRHELVFSKKAANPRLRLDRCKDWPGMVLFGYYTGTRISDIARLTWENIDLSKGIATFVPSKTKKMLKFYQVPLHPSLILWLKQRCGKQKQTGPVCTRIALATSHQ